MVIAKESYRSKRRVVPKSSFVATAITCDATTLKNMDYTWTAGAETTNNQEAGVPRAIFIPHSNSLPFEERRVTLEQPVKIGRNVYRATPSPTNTIFECRVLSRHHATLYYDKGHFYLVDNQSSNGTFINNNRCSISKEQEPHEVFSGDVVQFGIPVVENAGNAEKNTFPPVVALLKLYHPDGKEAKLSFNPTMTTPLHLKELYQLNNYVQEAIQREAALEGRLRTLRECVERTRAEARASWELFVGEQRLLMRVHTLETMHSMGKQPDAHQVAELLNDKRNYQEVAQESLRAAHEQRLALEETLERRNREAAALQHHNAALRLAANNALAELQKLAGRCERKMCAARLAIAAAEERELSLRNQLPLTYSVQNGEAKILILSTDTNKLADAKRGGTLEDAVRALPDYIKLLLPANVLNKVGIKMISAEGKSSKEFDTILKKNNLYNLEKDKQAVEEESAVSGAGLELDGELPPCTDDEKQARLNHDTETESSSPLDGDLRPDNNANSTYTDRDNRDESPSKGGVEYANILRVMAGLNEEIKALRERLAATSSENEQLRSVRDELLAARQDDRDDACLATQDTQDLRAKIAELQAQLTRSNVSEEANLAEIQRLATATAEMQAELAFRPTRADIDDLSVVVGELRRTLMEKEAKIEQLKASLPSREQNLSDACVGTAGSLEDIRKMVDAADAEPIDTGKISAEIDEMFKLDFDEGEEETDSAVTELHNDDKSLNETQCYRIDDSERLQTSMTNGSLHALEEELVRAKERWAEVCVERARLAAQLAVLQRKPAALSLLHLVALAVPLLAACLYYLLLPHLS